MVARPPGSSCDDVERRHHRWGNIMGPGAPSTGRVVAALVAMVSLCSVATAAPRYDPGVTDSEIRIGQTMAYSGPASAYGTIGRVDEAYFKMINDQGGINGRRIRLI